MVFKQPSFEQPKIINFFGHKINLIFRNIIAIIDTLWRLGFFKKIPLYGEHQLLPSVTQPA